MTVPEPSILLQIAYLAVVVGVIMAGVATIAWRAAQGRGGVRGPGFVWTREEIGADESRAIGTIKSATTRTVGTGPGSYSLTLAPTNEPGAVDVQVKTRLLGITQAASAVLIEGKYVGMREGRKLAHWITLWQFIPLASLAGIGFSIAIISWRGTADAGVVNGMLLAIVAVALLWWSARRRKAAVRAALRAYSSKSKTV